MKIGVLTHSKFSDNYGQILQCFALQRFLLELGHEAFLIRYDSDECYQCPRFAWLRYAIRFVLRLVSRKRRELHKKILSIQRAREINAIRNKVREFEKFASDNIVSTAMYKSYEELKANPPCADAYVVGSDQVWNPGLNNPSTAVWYLRFGPKGVRRIAYAASFGRRIAAKECAKLHEYLSTFYAIGVREDGALENCKRAGESRARLVLDPTLLVPNTAYKSFICLNSKFPPYVFLYYLNVDSSEKIMWGQIRDFVAKQHLAIIPVSSSGYLPAMDLIPDVENYLPTVPEWLSEIAHAQYVITTSFHGMIFAIIFHRPFAIIPLQGGCSEANDRITSLLRQLDLMDRIITGDNGIEKVLLSPIKWDWVDSKVDVLREESRRFLINAISW